MRKHLCDICGADISNKSPAHCAVIDMREPVDESGTRPGFFDCTVSIRKDPDNYADLCRKCTLDEAYKAIAQDEIDNGQPPCPTAST